MNMRHIRRCLLLAALAAAPLCHADGLESKLEMLGKMDNIKVESARVVKRNDFLNVQAELSNSATKQQMLFYRFKWLDGSGMQTGAEETWKQLQLQGLERKSIQTVAPTPQAADFRLELQSPDNSVNLFR
ncbi:hypothetical protein AWB61_03680 [Chromobacterium sp. F49]|nr:hypothetical protein Cv017_06235 [Chromobacterium subtsugae]KZE84510.1 hypothetical protein AWB61_03680 [Chromobacterium sp. F49]